MIDTEAMLGVIRSGEDIVVAPASKAAASFNR
jgi:hypothetical protein